MGMKDDMDPELARWYAEHWEDQWDDEKPGRRDQLHREQGWDLEDVVAEFEDYWED